MSGLARKVKRAEYKRGGGSKRRWAALLREHDQLFLAGHVWYETGDGELRLASTEAGAKLQAELIGKFEREFGETFRSLAHACGHALAAYDGKNAPPDFSLPPLTAELRHNLAVREEQMRAVPTVEPILPNPQQAAPDPGPEIRSDPIRPKDPLAAFRDRPPSEDAVLESLIGTYRLDE